MSRLRLPGSSIVTGRYYENRARSFLRSKGLAFVLANYHCRGGEIDLIMRHGELLVFIEVRYRSNSNFGPAKATVTAAKQRRIRIAAAHFLQRFSEYRHLPCRFDVIGVERERGALKRCRFDWIPAAFY